MKNQQSTTQKTQFNNLDTFSTEKLNRFLSKRLLTLQSYYIRLEEAIKEEWEIEENAMNKYIDEVSNQINELDSFIIKINIFKKT